MKIICISDTHGLHRDVVVPDGDIIIFAGDFMTDGYDEEEVDDFLSWFSSLNIRHKIMIAGNHDRFVQNFPEEFKEKLPENIHYLEDSWVEIQSLKIYGTPWSKPFGGWAFNKSELMLQAEFDKIPDDTDILISHAPEYMMLDKMHGEYLGEKTLLDKIKHLYTLDLHVFGHIHNEFGFKKPTGGHISVNATQVDETYELTNFPITIDL